MTIPEIAAITFVVVAYLMVMLARARRRTRAQMRAARLRDAADPARGVASFVEDGEHHNDAA
jgi:hypothetical protein